MKDKVEVLDQALLTAEMFVAFSKKSPCTALAEKFGQAITEMTTDGSFDNVDRGDGEVGPGAGKALRPRVGGEGGLRDGVYGEWKVSEILWGLLVISGWFTDR